jgi:chromosome segregation ATPase
LTIVEECRTEVQFLEREGDNLLKDQTLRHKKLVIKDSNNDLSEKEEIYNLLTDRLRNLEQECSNLIQDKKELSDAL